ncbi:MAG TPA: hypothetical protein VFS16_06775, partial [Acidimicrobiia bacterium]|nr:hypothetical protein [Acidimicrobiia bacterium]
MGSLVAVDGGRSRCRAAVIGADGRPGPVVEGPGIPPGTGRSAADGIAESVAVTVTSAVVAAAAARHEVGQVAAVSAGLAGLLGARDLAPAVAGRLHDRLGAAGVTLCGDVVAAHAGALPDPDGGVVLVAGTGAVAFGAVPVRVPAPSPCADADRTLVGPLPGLGPTGAGGSDSAAADSAGAGRSAADSAGAGRSAGADGAGDGRAAPGSGDGWNDPGVADGAWVVDSAVACVDGWGHLLGDTGSGFWIGRRGLDAALRAHDGRGGGSPRLARLVERDIGPLDRLPDMAARAGAGPVAAIASFSVQVAEAASEGDEIARFIWLEAA